MQLMLMMLAVTGYETDQWATDADDACRGGKWTEPWAADTHGGCLGGYWTEP